MNGKYVDTCPRCYRNRPFVLDRRDIPVIQVASREVVWIYNFPSCHRCTK